MNYKTSDGIFALISGGLGSAVNVVRASCENSKIIEIAKAFKIKEEKLIPNHTFLAKILKNGEFLDECLVTYFKAPFSFTGEDCIEFALHGSPFILEEFYQTLLSINLRFALNGEFSYRAFLNGKLDLVEAEGMANLIASTTKLQHTSSKRQFLGEFSAQFDELRKSILDVLSFLESLIDFSDEDLPSDIAKNLENKVNEVKSKISSHLENTSILSLQEGLRLTIVGRPNAGKSSIFNKLCGFEKAIVSSHAGTTRDILEERLILKGIPLVFYDTAGIRKTKDEIEMEGIKRAIKTLAKSDIKLIVKSSEESESFEEIATEFGLKIDENTICITNKTDLKPQTEESIGICTLNGNGMKDLKQKIERILEKNFVPLISAGLIASERQKQMLEKALNSLNRFNLSKEIELAGEDLRRASICLEEIVGKVDVEDVLGNIFSKFCIGK
jgi:tRNA modification GTPase